MFSFKCIFILFDIAFSHIFNPLSGLFMKIRRRETATTSTQIRFVTTSEAEMPSDFSARPGESAIRYDRDRTFIYCGIGDAASCTLSILCSSAAVAAQSILKLKRSEFSVNFPRTGFDCVENPHSALLEGFLLGFYQFSKYKSEKPNTPALIELISTKLSPKEIRKIEAVSESVFYARDLVNENASVVTPSYLADEACKLTKNKRFTATIISGATLRKKKLNLIATVGQGAPVPPALIIMEYHGKKNSSAQTALVGKGVTFDSGGQNLKTTGNIETMRHDMAGAAAVLGVMKTCSILNPPINLIGVIPAVHNALGSNSFFPGDVYTAYSGKTVEIWSTDAEGRLILADAIAYCVDRYAPSEIIDLATLTGGIKSALGTLVAGLFSNNDHIAEKLFDAGEKTGERLWRFPLYQEYTASIKGDIGDLRNLSKFKKGYASSIVGAAFLQEFTDSVPWGHIDIAGTAFNEGGAGGIVPQFATGFGVRLLHSYLGIH